MPNAVLILAHSLLTSQKVFYKIPIWNNPYNNVDQLILIAAILCQTIKFSPVFRYSARILMLDGLGWVGFCFSISNSLKSQEFCEIMEGSIK